VPRYAGLLHTSEELDSSRCGTWQREEIRGTIRTLAVNHASIPVCSTDDGKTAAETSSEHMVKGTVRALCEFSLLVSQQNHSDLSLKGLHDAVKRFDQMKSSFREQKMSNSAIAKVDDLLAQESHQLCEQKIPKIRAAMVAIVDRAEKVSSTKRRQFQVRLERARQVAMTWSDADHQKA